MDVGALVEGRGGLASVPHGPWTAGTAQGGSRGSEGLAPGPGPCTASTAPRAMGAVEGSGCSDPKVLVEPGSRGARVGPRPAGRDQEQLGTALPI